MSPAGPLHLLLRDGPLAGQRVDLDGERARFGRACDNDVVLADARVSRHHGTLVRAETGWTLEVEGMNAVRVNRRKVGRRPRPLKHRDVVFVGSQPLFEILDAGSEPTTGAPDRDPDTASEGRPRLSRRSALWIGIGVYLLFMSGLILFLLTLQGNDNGRHAPLAPLSAADIEAMLRRPPVPREPYTAGMQAALDRARSLTERLDARADKLFEAYTAFRQAMALAPQGRLSEGRDILAYDDVRDRLTRSMCDLYLNAYQQFMSHQYEAAERGLTTLLQRFPDTTSPLHRSTVQILAETRSRRDEARKRGRQGIF